MCKGPVRENSIYCSDDCIRKHSQHAISQIVTDGSKKVNVLIGFQKKMKKLITF